MGTLWPMTIPLAVLIIGTRQLGLFILMHDAAHGLLHPDRRINDCGGVLAVLVVTGRIPALPPAAPPLRAAGRGPGPGPVGAVPDLARVAQAQAVARPERADLLQATHRAAAGGSGQGLAAGAQLAGAGARLALRHRQRAGLRGLCRRRPVVGVAADVAAADGHLAAAGHAHPQHRRACAGGPRPARSAAPGAHHAGRRLSSARCWRRTG